MFLIGTYGVKPSRNSAALGSRWCTTIPYPHLKLRASMLRDPIDTKTLKDVLRGCFG